MLELIANDVFIAVHGWRVWEVTESWREDMWLVSPRFFYGAASESSFRRWVTPRFCFVLLRYILAGLLLLGSGGD